MVKKKKKFLSIFFHLLQVGVVYNNYPNSDISIRVPVCNQAFGCSFYIYNRSGFVSDGAVM